VQTLVIGQASRFTALGIVLGAGLSFWLARWLESLVFRVQPADPVSISLASLGIGAIALLAAFLAARSAAGLNALDALRGDMTR
jgi:ABC-type lipoprotein release transport system permease subunit